MALSQWVTGWLREGWEKAGVDSAVHTAIAAGCNAVLVLNCLPKRKKGAQELRTRNWVSGSEVAKWHFPAPAPATLVKAHKVAEKMRFFAMALKGTELTATSVNSLYRKMYQEDLLPELPSISRDIGELAFGTQSSLSFSERVDALFLRSVIPHPILSEERVQQEGWPLLNAPGIIWNDLARLKQNLGQGVQGACLKTIQETRGERLAFIEALQGLALSFLYKKIAAQMPGKEVLIRELALAAFQNYFSGFLQGGLGFSQLFELDFVESAANQLASFAETSLSSEVATALATVGGSAVGGLLDEPFIGTMAGSAIGTLGLGRFARQVFIQGTTKGLEFGPPAAALLYQILYQELDQLASRGNQRLEDLSSVRGWYDLIQGNAPEVREAPALDPNSSYLAPIASEFVLGTLSRLCEGRGILAVLLDAIGEMSKERGEAPSSSEPLPGLEESKTALRTLLTSLREKFITNLSTHLTSVVEVEKKRQLDDASRVAGEIADARDAILNRHSAAIAGVLGGVVSPGTVKAVLDFPNTLVFGPATWAYQQLQGENKQ